MNIGLVSDSQGDIDALERACHLLLEKSGAERVLFLGNRWTDVDELVQRKREAKRGRPDYGDQDFLADVAGFVAKSAEAEKGGVKHLLMKDEIEAFASRFTRVPDKDSLQYRDPAIPRILPDMLGDRLSCLVHDKADLKREDIEVVTFVLHGNSKEPNVVQIGPRYFLTPGKVAGTTSPTCALVRSAAEGMEFVALDLDGRLLKKVPLPVGMRAKVTAR